MQIAKQLFIVHLVTFILLCMTTAIEEITEENVTKREIPKVFIAEYMDGVPLYYRGYKSIIDTPSKAEEIMGAGGIHFILFDFFYQLLVDNLDRKKYWRAGGESGIKLRKNDLFNLDIAVYLRSKLPAATISKHVVSIAPELIIEIDTSIEFDEITQDEYVFKKTQRLLDFGTQKLIWGFSATNRIMVAEPNAPRQIYTWNTTLELIDGITFNLEAYCRENELENLLNL